MLSITRHIRYFMRGGLPGTTFTLATLLCCFPGNGAELEPTDAGAGDNVGHAVSVSGTLGLVGAPGDYNQDTISAGAGYLFTGMDTALGTVSQTVKLVASDAFQYLGIGRSACLDGTSALLGPTGDNRNAVYFYRGLGDATGTIEESAILSVADPSHRANFGSSVSLSGSTALVGAERDDFNFQDTGSAYLFRNLNQAAGVVNESARLVASDRDPNDYFGATVALSQTLGLVAAPGADPNGTDSGTVYLFRNPASAEGVVQEDAKLVPSDSGEQDGFGHTMSLDGETALISTSEGYARVFLFRGLGGASGTVTETAEIAPFGADYEEAESVRVNAVALSGGTGLITFKVQHEYGDVFVCLNLDAASGLMTPDLRISADVTSVSLSGDKFVFGDPTAGRGWMEGRGFSGTISSFTTLDKGFTRNAIEHDFSFETRLDWIIGETTSANEVLLGYRATADVTRPGKGIYIGKNEGANNNMLEIDQGSIVTSLLRIGSPDGNTGNMLHVVYTRGMEVDTLRITPGNRIRLSGEYPDLDDLVSFFNLQTFEVWHEGAWRAVDETNVGDLLDIVYDSDEDETLVLVRAPEIVVTGNEVDINNGDATPGDSDGTAFGVVELGTGPVSRTFQVTNSGSAPLTVAPTVDSPHFTVEAVTSPIAPGEGAAFSVTYEPSEEGTHVATVTLETNDPDESPFTFTVGGEGVVRYFWNGVEVRRVGTSGYTHGAVGMFDGIPAEAGGRAWSHSLQAWITNESVGFFSPQYGALTAPEDPQWTYSSFFGWTHYGADETTYGGWVNTERFGWMKFEQAGQDTFLWVPMMNSWMTVNGNGSFTSFQWGQLTPEGLNRYQSSIFGGLTTGDFRGWVASDRFGWMWTNGDGTWFWSETRQEWLGVTAEGGIWSTAEERFL